MTNRKKRGTNRTYGWEAGAVWERQFFKKLLAKVEKLNDERNWRKGMRVRLLLRCLPKSVLKSRKSEFDGYLDDEEVLSSETAEDSSHPNNSEFFETNISVISLNSSQDSILAGFMDNASIQRDASCFDGVPIYVKELVAGGFASVLSKTSVVPLERVKILWQVSWT
ncbi:hypothetical protein RJT34_07618 [Clitoria ternatea]|uniref:Uncharacterized protein n=1 Tax=Clitoria ternatea TaxID=43366 RepID=A0AAN9PU39_CLITE